MYVAQENCPDLCCMYFIYVYIFYGIFYSIHVFDGIVNYCDILSVWIGEQKKKFSLEAEVFFFFFWLKNPAISGHAGTDFAKKGLAALGRRKKEVKFQSG